MTEKQQIVEGHKLRLDLWLNRQLLGQNSSKMREDVQRFIKRLEDWASDPDPSRIIPSFHHHY